ncbi:MAG: class I SAM-dependent methyltransferase [Thermodesulfobacteriota bacterium]
MLLGTLEKQAMNNPVRAASQRHYEAPRLLRLGGPAKGARALEMGCGRGEGIKIILDIFEASTVDAFDLDPHMVELARKRTAHLGGRVKVSVGDAAAIAAGDATYDAVFDFGIIHHVPEWRKAVAAAFRVLKPGGRFYTEEVFRRFLEFPLVKRLFPHPTHDRFDYGQYLQGLADAGFSIRASKNVLDVYGFIVAEKP